MKFRCRLGFHDEIAEFKGYETVVLKETEFGKREDRIPYYKLTCLDCGNIRDVVADLGD